MKQLNKEFTFGLLFQRSRVYNGREARAQQEKQGTVIGHIATIEGEGEGGKEDGR